MPLEDIEQRLRNARFVHLTEDELHAHLRGTLEPVTSARVEAHLKLCLICSRRLEFLAGEQAALASAAVSPEDLAIARRVLRQHEERAPAVPAPKPGRDRQRSALDQLAAILGLAGKNSGTAAPALRTRGAAPARRDLLARLPALLGDPDKKIRLLAARAVEEVGSAAVTADLLARLKELLADPEPPVRAAARHALLDRALQALQELPLGFSPGFSSAESGLQGEAGDGLLRWSLDPDLESPGSLVLFLTVQDPNFASERIRVTVGEWSGEILLEPLPWEPATIGGYLVLGREQRQAVTAGTQPRFEVVRDAGLNTGPVEDER